jgi:hypothetical protein
LLPHSSACYINRFLYRTRRSKHRADCSGLGKHWLGIGNAHHAHNRPLVSHLSSDKGEHSQFLALYAPKRAHETENRLSICHRLQTVILSIMSARIVFHVVEMTPKDISHAESSLEAQGCLTTHIEMEGVVVSPSAATE